ncbi:alanine racemase [Desulfurella multipotens]|uniref:Alanine racemase n=1 Tax=Desulfurella multipotens TaxID=79269 RepID=A0A1G6KKI1_9BACT|nr:alanine racemase [Desulfurella multipotens]SDC31612.1 alanine racemase [Desulfurella multipotens]
MYEVIKEINLKTIVENFKNIQNYVGNVDVIPVIKADAYGHGAIEVAQSLISYVKSYFAVAFTQEAIELRKNNIKNNILILSRSGFDDVEDLYNYNLTPVVHDFFVLQSIIDFSKSKKCRLPIHLKFNTGMNRLGFNKSDLNHIIELYKKNKDFIDIVGVMSHFSSSESDVRITSKQIDEFEDIVNTIKSSDLDVRYYHIANSGGLLNYKNAYFNAVRAGISLYGYYPKKIEDNPINIKPAMSIKSFIISKRIVNKGEGISYGPSFIADKDMQIAIVAFGYADGLFRCMSNKFNAIVNDKICKSVGTICMDMFAIDVSDVEARVGDEVIIMGESKNCKIDADDLARFASTINYEILTNIGKSLRTKKVYI